MNIIKQTNNLRQKKVLKMTHNLREESSYINIITNLFLIWDEGSMLSRRKIVKLY